MRGIQLVLLVLALALFVVALSGCTATGSGTASVYVKDAPTDEFQEIHVVFTKVEVHRSAGADGNGTGNATDDGDVGWLTLYENATGQDVDLLDASGARAAFLGEAELDAGRYQQVRIHTTEAYGVQDGARVDFELSNGVLKVPRGFEVRDGEETRIVLDFDLDRSLKQTGQGWRMTPVVGTSSAEVVQDDESGAEAHEEGEVADME